MSTDAEWSPERWARWFGLNAWREHQTRLAEQQSAAAAEEWARSTRLYWSGRADPITRQILRAFNVSARDIGLVQRSAFSPEYRRRQRARVKRRRR